MRSRIVPVIGMAALLTACGDKADDNNNEQTKSISGVVNSTDYTVPAKPSFLSSISDFLFGKETYAIGGSIVDTVVAVPFTPGSSMGPYLMTDKIEVPIDSAGQAFNLALPTHYDWVLLLVNSNATAKQDKVVAYVTMSASAVENLVGMPMSDASGDVDLGTVSKNPDNNEEVESSNMATTLAASFSLSATQLLDMAKTDDAYKNLINYYLNYDTTTGAYFAPTTRFNWEAPVSATLASTIGATVAPATAYDATSFKGYFIYMGYSQTKNSPTLAELCAGTTTLDFAPPADVTAGTSVYGPTGADGAVIPGWEVSNPDMCSAGSIASSITSDNVLTNYPQGGQNISGSIPSGWWQLKRGGATGTV
ncbi:MAG: hypothetical protein OEX00_02685, partial [Gammaproteobacteria bacterium]|nr:hypothetical protein [Gammaproteobacteria bacterium]